MKSKPKYVHYVGTYLKAGQYQGMELNTDYSLTGNGSGSYLYIAPVFDSLEDGNTWQSLRIEGDFYDCKLEVVVAASDYDYRETLDDPNRSCEEKEAFIRSLDGIRKVNTMDILLTSQQGRFLYLFFKISGQRECDFQIRMASVEFPKNSFLEYFPEVYQTKDDFFERYISIFQTMYLDVEKRIDNIPLRLDYEKAEYEDLLQLADWIGMDEWIVKEAVKNGECSRLRQLIRFANDIYSAKGTIYALKLVLNILYDEEIKILEYFKWYEYLENRPEELSLYQSLYGKDSSLLTILVEEKDGSVFSEAEKKSMQKVVSCMLPIGMKSHLIYLKSCYHMDTHCYLDNNSVLASLESANSDGMPLYGNVFLQ